MTETEKNRELRIVEWQDAVIMLALIVALLVYFRSILWTNEYIYGELDIRRHFYFFKSFSFELMRAGEAPLWIPHLYCGMPLLAASQVTPYYPIDLALMVARIPMNMVFNWDLIIHLIAAQVFSYLFFKRLFGWRAVAIFCSMWFWNSFFLNSIITGDALNIRGMLLAPAVFYFTEASLEENARPHNFMLGSLALAMQILCGGLQFTFYTMVCASAYAGLLLALRMYRRESVLRPALGFAGLVIVALALSGIQLAPAWEYSRLSVRGTGVEWFKAWALQPFQMIDYVLPAFQGGGKQHGYFGIAALALAAYSLPFWKGPRKYFFLVMGAMAIVYSFGGNTTISSYLAGLPLVRDFRGPFRAAIFFNLSVFILAGGAYSSLLDPETEIQGRRRLWGFAVVATGLVAGFVGIAIYAHRYPGWNATRVISSAVFLVATIVLVAILLFGSRKRNIVATVLVLALAVDIGVSYWSFFSPTSISDLFRRDATVTALEKIRGDRSSRIAVYNTAHANYFGLFGFESANGHHPFPLARHATFMPLLQYPRVASLCGVENIIVYGAEEDGHPNNPPVKKPNEVSIRPPSIKPSPRAFLAGKYRLLSADDIPEEMARRIDFAKEVILEEAPKEFDKNVLGKNDAPLRNSVSINSHKATEVHIKTNAESDSVLVLTDSYYPGWIAEVDGERKEILRANYIFRGIPITAGEHAVTFKFQPLSFSIGKTLSLAGMVILFLWAAVLFVRRRS